MSINNLKIMSQMAIDKNVIRSIFDIYNILREDKQFISIKIYKNDEKFYKG